MGINVSEVVENVALHPVGPPLNRDAAPPKIEIVGRWRRCSGSGSSCPSLSRERW
jgi:hypothetical protein